jgi:hypothetical protein
MTTPRLVRISALVLGACTLLAAPPRTAAQVPAGASERQIFVTVLDKSGAVVQDLAPSDVIVREDDEPRTVTGVTLATDPMWISLIVDTAKEARGTDATRPDLIKGLTSFVSTVQSTSEGSGISLTECAGAAVVQVEFTTNTSALRSAIQHLAYGPQPETVMLEAIVDSSKRLSRVSSPRRVIVTVDFVSSVEGSDVLPLKVGEAVHSAGASFWALSVQRSFSSIGAVGLLGVDARPPDSRHSVLALLPDATGGQHLNVFGTSLLEATLLKLADALTHQYLVTYVRPDARPVSSITASSPRGEKALIAPLVR